MNKENANNSVFDVTIRLFVLLLIIAWCLLIMYPFVNIILWSLILAMAMHPLHNTLANKMGGRFKLASVIIVLSIFAVIFVPIGFLIGSLVDEVKELKVHYDNGELSIPPPTEKVKEWPIIGPTIYETWQTASVDIEQILVKYQDQLTEIGSTIGKGILGAVSSIIQIFAALIIAGILLIFRGTGEEIRKFFRKLAGNRGDEFADVTLKTVGNVVKGILGVALILALLHGIVFMVAGVPYAGIWTLLVFILGVLQIPLFFITLPIIIFMFATKELIPAIMWTILMIIVGFSDNILKPILLGKGAPVPMLVVFIGVIGGFILSGFIGLFTGAIIMSVGYKLFVGWINSNNEMETN